LRNGRIRVSIAVPPDADPTTATLTLRVEGWVRSSGGHGPMLSCSTRLNVVESSTAPIGSPTSGKASARSDVAQVGLLWSSHEAEEGWDANTVGVIEMIEADTLAALDEQYSELKGVHVEIPVLRLNEEFSPLKAYSSVRARDVGDEGVARAKDRYAFGVGVQMFLIERLTVARRAKGDPVDDDWVASMTAAAARGVLAVLPDFDTLLSEVGLDGL
jgi:hypothetical protein